MIELRRGRAGPGISIGHGSRYVLVNFILIPQVKADIMKKIAIFAKVHDPRCQGVAEELVRWLRKRDLVPLLEPHLARHIPDAEGVESTVIPLQADLAVVLGGD